MRDTVLIASVTGYTCHHGFFSPTDCRSLRLRCGAPAEGVDGTASADGAAAAALAGCLPALPVPGVLLAFRWMAAGVAPPFGPFACFAAPAFALPWLVLQQRPNSK